MRKRWILAINLLTIALVLAFWLWLGFSAEQGGPAGCPQQETYSTCPTAEDLQLTSP